MKRLLTLAIFIAATSSAFSQSLDYNDLGLLFAKDDNYGTARFEAMSGAFGALGGDISAFGINPAGSAVSKSSSASITLGNRNTINDLSYYGNTFTSEEDFFNVSQAGAILSFDSAYSSDWTRFAFTFNYRIKSDFDHSYTVNGNSGFLFNTTHFNDPSDPKIQFDRSLSQAFSAGNSGEVSVFNLGFSAAHQNKLFIGGALNFHNINFSRTAILTENNDDIDGNILNARNRIDTYIQGNGISLSLGFIYKANANIRLGLAYESPTWYEEIVEDYADRLTLSDVDLPAPQADIMGGTDIIGDLYTYRFRTNSKITASGAFIFGKKGLISVDYTYKDYQNIRFPDNTATFNDVNNNFENQFRGSHGLNVGAEWRFDRVSLRGGAHYEKNPNLLSALGGNTNKDNIRGFSAGLGYNFGNVKLDFSYRKSENQQFETLYNLGDIGINNNTSRISGTLTISL